MSALTTHIANIRSNGMRDAAAYGAMTKTPKMTAIVWSGQWVLPRADPLQSSSRSNGNSIHQYELAEIAASASFTGRVNDWTARQNRDTGKLVPVEGNGPVQRVRIPVKKQAA